MLVETTLRLFAGRCRGRRFWFWLFQIHSVCIVLDSVSNSIIFQSQTAHKHRGHYQYVPTWQPHIALLWSVYPQWSYCTTYSPMRRKSSKRPTVIPRFSSGFAAYLNCMWTPAAIPGSSGPNRRTPPISSAVSEQRDGNAIQEPGSIAEFVNIFVVYHVVVRFVLPVQNQRFVLIYLQFDDWKMEWQILAHSTRIVT